MQNEFYVMLLQSLIPPSFALLEFKGNPTKQMMQGCAELGVVYFVSLVSKALEELHKI